MHLFLATRGISQSRDIWKKFMETQMFVWKRSPLVKNPAWKEGMPDEERWLKNPDGTYMRGQEELSKVQGALRPIEFYEYVFPEERLPEVLAMLNLHDNQMRPEMRKIAWVMRKLLTAEPVPEFKDLKGKESWQITDKYIPMMGMAVYPIGIKKDVIQDYPNYGFYQEGL